MRNRQPSHSLMGSDPRPKPNGRQSEYFGLGESWSKHPNDRSVQVYNPDMSNEQMKSTLFGEHLHALGSEDKGWIEKKKRFYDLFDDGTKNYLKYKHSQMSLPQDQRTDDDVKEHYSGYQEKRSYEDWLDRSEMDQWIGGMINPPNEEWANQKWSPEHRALKEEMMEYLRSQ
jgi:hypothetical protein